MQQHIQQWQHCKKILCIRPDNMGDLLMNTPAIAALKQLSGAHLTVLTSSMAAGIAKNIPVIDEIMVFDAPWVKTWLSGTEDTFTEAVDRLRKQQFDAAVIFTVYSQNPMPAIMLAYLAGIPLRLAYCRENPYQLLTHWVPDEEPYTCIKHQVRRDLDLVAAIGALPLQENMILNVPESCWHQVQIKMEQLGINLQKPWLLMHPGVSEPKREYPFGLWAEAARKTVTDLSYQVLFTGSAAEKELTDKIQIGAGPQVFSVAGQFSLDEFIVLIKYAPLLISVNTGSVHIAAATKTPVVVLYALTNPQHTPWKVASQVLPFKVPAAAQSKNEVIRYVNQYFAQNEIDMPCADDVIAAAKNMLFRPDKRDTMPNLQ